MQLVRNIFFLIVLGSLAVVEQSWASNLLEVYEAALVHDPQFKIARATWLADRENLAIQRSHFLPHLTLNAGVRKTEQRMTNDTDPRTSTHRNRHMGYRLTLGQPLFDFHRLAALWGTRAAVGRAYAIYLAEEELLLYRLAEGYFNVLLASKSLAYAQAYKKANEQFFSQAQHKYTAGLIPITDLAESKRNFKRAQALEAKSQSDLASAYEVLQEMTGTRYVRLAPLGPHFPLLPPHPSNLEAWEKAAEQHNFELLAANYQVSYARENIKIKQAGHYPVLGFRGNYDHNYQSNIRGESRSARNRESTFALELSLPLYEGGKVTAEVRAADFIYQRAIGELERKHREIISLTRRSYIGLIATISALQADEEAIQAAERTLKSMQANYRVGKKTMSDVLDAQSKLYATQMEFAKDEYSYILLFLKLKMCTGTLGVADLEELNSWLVAKNSSTPSGNRSTSILAVRQPKRASVAKIGNIIKTKDRQQATAIRVLSVGKIENQ